jgi:hypothetical protein
LNYPVYEITQNATIEVFDDGALILNLKDLTLTELNFTGCEILQKTDGKKDVAQIASQLAADYEISFNQALPDVQELCQTLLKQGILQAIKPVK